ncbi:hypothetical protein IAU59_005737 [Kwoniella sp. CBS 9459]
MPRHFRPFGRRGSADPASSAAAPDSSRVRNRLHALFNSHSSSPPPEQEEPEPPSSRRGSRESPQVELEVKDQEPGFRNGQDVIRSKTFPLELEGSGEAKAQGMAETVVIPPNKQREAIKVMVVTWNMGDALPKGDLSVLFGQIPPYQPHSPADRLPQLGVENAHPYHIVVVAGQECPTLSNVPRGLGGGLVKGVTLRHKKDKEKNAEKDKDKGNDKDKEKDKEKQTQKDGQREKAKEEMLEILDREDSASKSPDQGDSDEEDRGKDSSDQPRSRATSPMTPHTPFLNRHPQAPKGWSQMLDDYFCGPNARAAEPLPSSYDSSSPVPKDSPFLPHPPRFPTAQPSLLRSASAPITPVSTPQPIPPRAPLHGPLSLGVSPSPLARSRSSFESNSTSSSSAEGDDTFLDVGSDENRRNNREKSISSPPRPRPKMERPEIIIPNDEPSSTGGGNGSYVHVVKERLLGMYLSVYVYKGCEHLIQGLDKDLVTAGLAGGRVGNKGGIGISLKLADHRFLFVNSHLAAHTGRLHARLSNIAKIKSELRLDCFLPKDDPRANVEDITERFDTTFWCGDLNFRLELSRLHADWLIEQKKYSDLLKWDQLKVAMQDPNMNPFPGFEEGPIDFPCTFKYDVWKSVSATNRELRRTLKRRKSTASAASIEISTSATMQQKLSHVPEGDSIEEVEGDCDGDGEEVRDLRDRRSVIGSDDDGTEAEMSRRSFQSSRYTSGANSTIGTDLEDESDDVQNQNQNQNQNSKHRAFEAALKEKTKHFLGLVKMDGILTSSPGRRGLGRRVSAKRRGSVRRPRHSGEFDHSSRRTSMSSFVSTNEKERERDDRDRDAPFTPVESERRVSMTSTRYDASTEDDPLSNRLAPPAPKSDNSHSSATPSSPPQDGNRDRDRDAARQPFGRRLSIMKRTMSNKSVRDALDDEDEEDEPEIEVDRREGVYDSSKKQRVPSWCDRVLWKAHVEPDPDEEPEADDIPVTDTHTPFHRLTTVFTNLGGHLKLQMTRTPSMEPSPIDRINVRIKSSPGIHRSGSSTPPRFGTSGRQPDGYAEESAETTFVSSPPDSPRMSASSPNAEVGLIPAPRKASPSPLKANSEDDYNRKQHLSSNVDANAARSAPSSRAPTNLLQPLAMSRSGSAPGHSSRPISSNSSAPSSGSITPIFTQSSPDPPRPKLTFDSPISPTADRLRVYKDQRPRSNSVTAGAEQDRATAPKKGRSSDGLIRSDSRPRSAGGNTSTTENGLSSGILSKPVRGDSVGSLRIFDQGKRARTVSQYETSPTQANSSDHNHGHYNDNDVTRNKLHFRSQPSSSQGYPHDHTHLTSHNNSNSSGNSTGNGLPRTTTIHTHTHPSASTGHGAREHDKNAFLRFLKDLPGWLHRSSSAHHDVGDDGHSSEIDVVIREKKWKKGEVRCLHYGTIDDAGMRQLEGRSDHRPAIFTGAVYI